MSEIAHKRTDVSRGQGRDWQVCLECGALWVLEGYPGYPVLVEDGDGSCEEED